MIRSQAARELVDVVGPDTSPVKPSAGCEDGMGEHEGGQVSAERNVEMIGQLFDAFSRGDIASVLAALTDDVDWQGPVSEQPGSLPWAGRRRGREQVAD